MNPAEAIAIAKRLEVAFQKATEARENLIEVLGKLDALLAVARRAEASLTAAVNNLAELTTT